jgi:hypothetical protein
MCQAGLAVFASLVASYVSSAVELLVNMKVVDLETRLGIEWRTCLYAARHGGRPWRRLCTS